MASAARAAGDSGAGGPGGTRSSQSNRLGSVRECDFALRGGALHAGTPADQRRDRGFLADYGLATDHDSGSQF